nr:hypothetical protein [Gammaproteobacteria bacterium]
GVTALHEAAINGDEVIVELLVKHGANPGLRDTTFNGDAAGWAHAGGHLKLCERLRAGEGASSPVYGVE